MTSNPGFTMDQRYVVLPPRPVPAYPVPHKEWERLKTRIGDLYGEPPYYQTAGPLLIGVALTTLTSIALGLPPSANSDRALVVAWAIVTVTLILGFSFLDFAKTKRTMRRVSATDIVEEMNVIQARFEPVDDGPPPPKVTPGGPSTAPVPPAAINAEAK
jgi:hypothetical protein